MLTPRLSLVASMTSIMFRNFSHPVWPCPYTSELCIDTAAIVDTVLFTHGARVKYNHCGCRESNPGDVYLLC